MNFCECLETYLVPSVGGVYGPGIWCIVKQATVHEVFFSMMANSVGVGALVCSCHGAEFTLYLSYFVVLYSYFMEHV